MDGGMIHIRREGWKEFKVGSLFELEKKMAWDERVKETASGMGLVKL